MVQCDNCGIDVDLPFKCNYCGGYFCSRHRLPEFHSCPSFYPDRRTSYSGDPGSGSSYDYTYQQRRQRTYFNEKFRFSEREIRDLGIGLLLVSALPLMWFRGLIFDLPLIFVGAVIIFAAAFLLHEIAHKFIAQRVGYWAEFRINQMGLMITFLSFFSPIKLVAPGAVMIAGRMRSDDYGKISLAGPLTNIAQAIIFLALGFTFPHNQPVYYLSVIGLAINSTLALFNLLPIGMFDGAKIMRWDWRIWLATALPTFFLYIYSIF